MLRSRGDDISFPEQPKKNRFHNVVTASPLRCHKQGLVGEERKSAQSKSLTMKLPIYYSLLELGRRAAGLITAAAMFLGPSATLRAKDQQRPLNGNSLQRLHHIIVIFFTAVTFWPMLNAAIALRTLLL